MQHTRARWKAQADATGDADDGTSSGSYFILRGLYDTSDPRGSGSNFALLTARRDLGNLAITPPTPKVGTIAAQGAPLQHHLVRDFRRRDALLVLPLLLGLPVLRPHSIRSLCHQNSVEAKNCGK